MRFNSTVIFVKDIEKSKDFYTRFLGFSIIHDFGGNVILNNSFTLWKIQPDHIINKELKTINDSNRFELYFESNNIDRVFKDLENGGVEFLHKIHEESWGQRTIRFFDPDRHLIEIGEPFEVFVQNLSKRGLNEEQISEKTGIPKETVIRLKRNEQYDNQS